MVAAEVKREQVFEWLANVPDPEIPVLSILDLGIVRDVDVSAGVTVTLTPTYSGCPATEVIESTVLMALRQHGVVDVAIKRVLSPPWTTDWITADGREKLRRYGIAPPSKEKPVACPQCESLDTECVSEFGSTACKAAWRCRECLEPFEYFKCL
ncbi:MAG: phenylacetate-CoA oxygenase subunit PaaJ [Proteobacteria bacterium]|nr:phenylacetate-CoA oxygenase subunit PaaJ [Pseudomonadota bacterium]MCH9005172.1 phenylacetate-CoA oxygenase subunit PaaJ [Pseudomonadota bacterium]